MQVTIHLKDHTAHTVPKENLSNIMRIFGQDITRIDDPLLQPSREVPRIKVESPVTVEQKMATQEISKKELATMAARLGFSIKPAFTKQQLINLING